MKIYNFIQFLIHCFISFYLLFILYWQSSNYKISLCYVPHVIHIAIPILIKGICYQNMHGEFSGILIDELNTIFIKKLNIKVEYISYKDSYFNINDFDCILNLNELKYEKNTNFINSLPILNTMEIFSIKKNNNNNNNDNLLYCKDDVFYSLHNNHHHHHNNQKSVNSIQDALNFLENNSEYTIIMSQFYYTEHIIKIKNFIKQNYIIESTLISIQPIRLLFNYKLYWLIEFFNIAILKNNTMKEKIK